VLASVLIEQQLLDGLAADLGDLALEIAHTGFARVVAHDVEQRAVRDLQLPFLESILSGLLWHQVTPADVEFFILGVAGQPDYFHAIEQWRRNVE